MRHSSLSHAIIQTERFPQLESCFKLTGATKSINRDLEAKTRRLDRAHRKRSDAVRTRIDKAIKALRREHADITISSVARRAGVTRRR
jgi:hypothetical protein